MKLIKNHWGRGPKWEGGSFSMPTPAGNRNPKKFIFIFYFSSGTQSYAGLYVRSGPPGLGARTVNAISQRPS